MDNKERFISLCARKLREKGLDSELYRERLKVEIKEADNQQEHEYFMGLVDSGARFAENENNLLCAFLLDLVPDFDINSPSPYIQGEYPDIDIDYLPEVRAYLKNVWAPKMFGVDNTCAIGNYTTFGIKSALIDAARVHGRDRKEILMLTTKLGLKDDEGNALTWDKALEMHEELREYCDKNPDVVDMATRLLNRNRGMGMHAGGLIVASKRIDDLVPLVKGKDNAHVSAFVEGLSGQDLGPLGLIKFDLLVIVDLLRIVTACQLIKQRYGVEAICAMKGDNDQWMQDWSDTVYLNDPQSLSLANNGHCKGIFQFDGEGIQRLLKRGGVTRFDDLVAYSALYRPGPLGMGMDDTFIKRKRGEERFELHPLLRPILGTTYGVMCYQEQVMQILNVVGDIPLVHCEKLRKAISKKNEGIFLRYKDDFIKNGQKRLGWSAEQVEFLWAQLEEFSAYGFNLSHATAYTYISSRLLWLKAHYPLEFFAATLQCASTDDKIKEIKREARKMNVKLNRVDINRSDWNFKIVNDEIYMGFSNVKGIGEDVAKRIVDNQPYASFEDFLKRFGTDSNAIKPLICLGVFEDADRSDLWEFYQFYKEKSKKREERGRRNLRTRDKIIDETLAKLQVLDAWDELKGDDLSVTHKDATMKFLEHCRHCNSQKEFAECISEFSIPIDVGEMWPCVRKYKRNVEGIKKKLAEDEEITMDGFECSGHIDEDIKLLFRDIIQAAEEQFYGFAWDHIIEYSPDYDGGRTLDQFEDETKLTLLVEAQICKKIEKRTSKKGKLYYVSEVEDANGVKAPVTIWEEDYERFKEEFGFWDDNRKGNLLKIRLERPGQGFRSYTFDSPPRHMRRNIPDDKRMDPRLAVMRWPESIARSIEATLSEQELLDKLREGRKSGDEGSLGDDVLIV